MTANFCTIGSFGAKAAKRLDRGGRAGLGSVAKIPQRVPDAASAACASDRGSGAYGRDDYNQTELLGPNSHAAPPAAFS